MTMSSLTPSVMLLATGFMSISGTGVATGPCLTEEAITMILTTDARSKCPYPQILIPCNEAFCDFSKEICYTMDQAGHEDMHHCQRCRDICTQDVQYGGKEKCEECTYYDFLNCEKDSKDQFEAEIWKWQCTTNEPLVDPCRQYIIGLICIGLILAIVFPAFITLTICCLRKHNIHMRDHGIDRPCSRYCKRCSIINWFNAYEHQSNTSNVNNRNTCNNDDATVPMLQTYTQEPDHMHSPSGPNLAALLNDSSNVTNSSGCHSNGHGAVSGVGGSTHSQPSTKLGPPSSEPSMPTPHDQLNMGHPPYVVAHQPDADPCNTGTHEEYSLRSTPNVRCHTPTEVEDSDLDGGNIELVKARVPGTSDMYARPVPHGEPAPLRPPDDTDSSCLSSMTSPKQPEQC